MFMTSFKSSFENTNVPVLDPNIFLRMPAYVAATAVDLNGLTAAGKPFFSNGPKSLHGNPLDCPILCNWVFDNFILAEEPFAKALRSFETCVLVNNNLRRKLFSSLESQTTFDESFRITPVPFFICDFTLFIKLWTSQFYV